MQVHCILGRRGDVDRYAGEGHRSSLSLDQILLESHAPYLSCPTEILKLSFILHVFSPYQGQHYHVLVYTLQVPGQNDVQSCKHLLQVKKLKFQVIQIKKLRFKVIHLCKLGS